MNLLSKVERIERKWALHNATRSQFLIAILRNKLCFTKEYDSRKVNSIYFDDSNLNSLYENINGNTLKAKYRVRWYGNGKKIVNPQFEIKMKKGILSKKRVFRLDNKFDRISDESLKYLTTEVNNILKLKKNINPVLSTHYERDYFISSNKKIRCTLDDNLESIQLGYLKNYLIKKKFFRLVLEMKYNSEYDEYVRKNLKNLSDSRLSKNSKYLLSAIDDKFITN